MFLKIRKHVENETAKTQITLKCIKYVVNVLY